MTGNRAANQPFYAQFPQKQDFVMDTSIRQGDFLFTDNTVIAYLQNYRLPGYIKNRSNSIVPFGNCKFQFYNFPL